VAKRDKEEMKKGIDDLFSGGDLMSNVVAQDRKRSGREPKKEEPEYDNMTSKNVIKNYDNTTSHKAVKRTSRQTRKSASPTAAKAPKSSTDPEPPRSSKNPKEGTLSRRIEEAQQMAESPTMTVTLRIPQQLNEWLDEYTHGAWKEKIKKQDLVIEGICLSFARRGRYGEEVLSTELLPDE
jgi:hypothetical protein